MEYKDRVGKPFRIGMEYTDVNGVAHKTDPDKHEIKRGRICLKEDGGWIVGLNFIFGDNADYHRYQAFSLNKSVDTVEALRDKHMSQADSCPFFKTTVAAEDEAVRTVLVEKHYCKICERSHPTRSGAQACFDRGYNTQFDPGDILVLAWDYNEHVTIHSNQWKGDPLWVAKTVTKYLGDYKREATLDVMYWVVVLVEPNPEDLHRPIYHIQTGGSHGQEVIIRGPSNRYIKYPGEVSPELRKVADKMVVQHNDDVQ